jgi:hypothetical protein
MPPRFCDEMRCQGVAMFTYVVMILMVWLVMGVLIAWVLGRAADLGSRDDVRLEKADPTEDFDVEFLPIKH